MPMMKKKPSALRMRRRQMKRLKRRRMIQTPLKESLVNHMNQAVTPQMKEEIKEMRNRMTSPTNMQMQRMPRPRMLTEKRQKVRERLIRMHTS